MELIRRASMKHSNYGKEFQFERELAIYKHYKRRYKILITIIKLWYVRRKIQKGKGW